MFSQCTEVFVGSKDLKTSAEKNPATCKDEPELDSLKRFGKGSVRELKKELWSLKLSWLSVLTKIPGWYNSTDVGLNLTRSIR